MYSTLSDRDNRRCSCARQSVGVATRVCPRRTKGDGHQGRSQDFMNGGAQLGAAKLLATPTN